MLWRDADYIIWQEGYNRHEVSVHSESIESEFSDWIDGYEGHVLKQRRQEFLLDYIEYLFESAIVEDADAGSDRQLYNEDLDRQSAEYHRLNPSQRNEKDWVVRLYA